MRAAKRTDLLSFEDAIEKYTKDYVEDLYIFQKLNNLIIAEKLNVSKSCLFKIYNYYGLKREHPKEHYCVVCGAPIPNTKSQRYSKTCSEKCAESCREQTMMERYGVTSTFYDTDKIKASWITKLGTDNPSKSKKVRNKVKKTSLKKYGVDCTLNSVVSKEKAINTSIERYGTQHPQSSDIIKNKISKSWENKSKEELDSIKERRAETNLLKFGVVNPFSSDEIKEKIKTTVLDRYGVEYSAQNPEVIKKQKETVREKIKLDKEYYSKISQKRFETNLKKYGVKSFAQNDTFRGIIQNIWANKSQEEIDSIVAQRRMTNIQRYGINAINQFSHGNHSESKPNKKFANLLKENNINFRREVAIGKYYYDFLVNDYLIEINPTITHNIDFIPFINGKPKDKNYHLNKTMEAIDNNYKCLHIWEWDDVSKVLDIINSNKTKIYARNCVIESISKQEADNFLNNYHLQGTCNGQIYRYALKYNGEVIQLLTFGKPRYNKHFDFELLRLCTKSGYSVIGGAEKLFKHFVNEFPTSSIISYCDFSKFSGGVYKKLGFTFIKRNTPSIHWHSPNKKYHITDNLLRQRGFDQLFGTNFGKGTSNVELMLQHKYYRVCDCGQLVFGYNIHNKELNDD